MPLETIICLDTGAASFQISEYDNGTINVFGDSWGSSSSFKILVEDVLHKSLNDVTDPNPVGTSNAALLTDILISKFQEPSCWIVKSLKKKKVIGIGGRTSATRLSSLLLLTNFINLQSLESSFFKISQFTSQEQLSEYPQPSLAIAKIGLLISIIKKTNIESFYYYETNGNTLGLFLYKNFW
eukprot:TRINITY_DN7024_c0_g1_i2.p1 TRINITY_DN7024_c0_g1~~TRINITY_DN7024_c0_g1_i2.p1  ORF type:complete len:183 (+),score=17.42 TRINITY_DN7024_c0_g1_i2:393-941(+)